MIVLEFLDVGSEIECCFCDLYVNYVYQMVFDYGINDMKQCFVDLICFYFVLICNIFYGCCILVKILVFDFSGINVNIFNQLIVFVDYMGGQVFICFVYQCGMFNSINSMMSIFYGYVLNGVNGVNGNVNYVVVIMYLGGLSQVLLQLFCGQQYLYQFFFGQVDNNWF